MANYSKGETYMDHFAVISEHFIPELTLELAFETVDVFDNFAPSIWMLMDSGNHLNDTLISSSFSTDFVDLLYDYRALDNDTYYVSIIDEVISDIQSWEGMTVSQFLNDIED